VAGPDPSNVTQENPNYMLLLAVGGVENLEQALAQYFSPFHFGDNVYQRWLQTMPVFLFINLHRLGDRRGQSFKHCHSIKFNKYIDLSKFTNPLCAQARYELIGIISHQGTAMTQGHYIAFCYINQSWYLFDDSHVQIVDEIAVFQDNYPIHQTSQTAVLLVYEKSNL
jgi:hypothetical protein